MQNNYNGSRVVDNNIDGLLGFDASNPHAKAIAIDLHGGQGSYIVAPRYERVGDSLLFGDPNHVVSHDGVELGSGLVMVNINEVALVRIRYFGEVEMSRLAAARKEMEDVSEMQRRAQRQDVELALKTQAIQMQQMGAVKPALHNLN